MHSHSHLAWLNIPLEHPDVGMSHTYCEVVGVGDKSSSRVIVRKTLDDRSSWSRDFMVRVCGYFVLWMYFVYDPLELI